MSVPADPEQNPPPHQPLPIQPRIGDAERDRAVEFLQEHMAQGRLDGTEFDDRLTRALRARTAADLEPLFEDLPEPRPGLASGSAAPSAPAPWVGGHAGAHPVTPAGSPPPAHREHQPRWVAVTLAAVWPAAILLSAATSFRFWWIWVVAAMVTYFLRRAFVPERSPDGRADPPALGH